VQCLSGEHLQRHWQRAAFEVGGDTGDLRKPSGQG
jgi:hypothetical protein